MVPEMIARGRGCDQKDGKEWNWALRHCCDSLKCDTLPHNVKAICHPEYLVIEDCGIETKRKQQCFALKSLFLSFRLVVSCPEDTEKKEN